jgi:hypothetical protein
VFSFYSQKTLVKPLNGLNKNLIFQFIFRISWWRNKLCIKIDSCQVDKYRHLKVYQQLILFFSMIFKFDYLYFYKIYRRITKVMITYDIFNIAVISCKRSFIQNVCNVVVEEFYVLFTC